MIVGGDDAEVAYDEDLAHRVRTLVADDEPLEQRMFGGLACLAGRHHGPGPPAQGRALSPVRRAMDTLRDERHPSSPAWGRLSRVDGPYAKRL
jgi:hypothetical protein